MYVTLEHKKGKESIRSATDAPPLCTGKSIPPVSYLIRYLIDETAYHHPGGTHTEPFSAANILCSTTNIYYKALCVGVGRDWS